MATLPISAGPVESLIAEARSGSSDALNQLMQVCRSRLHKEVQGSVDARLRTKTDESDLIQESLMLAYVHFSEFRGDTQAQLFAWLLRIAENKQRNDAQHWSAQKRDVDQEASLRGGPNDGGLLSLLPDHGVSPSGAAATNEEHAVVARALSALPDDYRRVIELRIWENCSFPTIGREMQRSEEAARKLFVRAVEHLEHLLSGQQ